LRLRAPFFPPSIFRVLFPPYMSLPVRHLPFPPFHLLLFFFFFPSPVSVIFFFFPPSPIKSLQGRQPFLSLSSATGRRPPPPLYGAIKSRIHQLFPNLGSFPKARRMLFLPFAALDPAALFSPGDLFSFLTMGSASRYDPFFHPLPSSTLRRCRASFSDQLLPPSNITSNAPHHPFREGTLIRHFEFSPIVNMSSKNGPFSFPIPAEAQVSHLFPAPTPFFFFFFLFNRIHAQFFFLFFLSLGPGRAEREIVFSSFPPFFLLFRFRARSKSFPYLTPHHKGLSVPPPSLSIYKQDPPISPSPYSFPFFFQLTLRT